MKLYGYAAAEKNKEELVPSELAEITLVANADELRKIASFLFDAATNMENMGDSYSHEHLSDKIPLFMCSPHFVVMSPK